MPRVPVHTVDSAPEASKETLEALAQQVGKVLNIFGGMAHAPAMLKMYASVEQLLSEQSSLQPSTRSAIHLTIANVNGCDYCQAAYTGAAKAAGYSLGETKDIRRGTVPGQERLSALLAVTREIAEHQGYVDDTTWKTATEVGWSEQELIEAYAEVIRTIMTSYCNHFVGTEIDLPEAPALA